MSGPEKRTLYFGPPTNFYEADRFDAFVRNNVKRELGDSSELNVEGELPNRTYNFPKACLGVRYHKIVEGRVTVDLLLTPRGRDGADKIQKLFFKEDNLP